MMIQMGLFNRNKISIASISIPEPNGWIETRNDAEVIQWENPENGAILAICFYEKKPDLPTIRFVEVLRGFYRKSVAQSNGGLVEVDIIKINEVSTSKTIFKFPQEPTGMAYIASLIIPFKRFSFVIKTQAYEGGITGMRDSFVANQFLKEQKDKSGEFGMEGWFRDPYDRFFTGGTLMNLSEQRKYDDQFPDHPLSIVRGIIDKLESQITFNEDVEKARLFG